MNIPPDERQQPKPKSRLRRRVIHGMIASAACLGLAVQVLIGLWGEVADRTLTKALGISFLISLCAFPIGFFWPLSEPTNQPSVAEGDVECGGCGERYSIRIWECPMCGMANPRYLGG